MVQIKQKTNKYCVNAKSKIYFADSVFGVIYKCGFPEKIKKSGKQVCIDYTGNLYSVKVKTHFCFENKRLLSVSYTTAQLPQDVLNTFLSEFENDIDSIMPISICYELNGKKYFELSDGYASECICVCCKNNKCYININFSSIK